MAFKYFLGQTVWYLKENRVHSAPILSLSRRKVENEREELTIPEQEKVYQQLGKSGTKYATIHGQFDESQMFASKQSLKKSL